MTGWHWAGSIMKLAQRKDWGASAMFTCSSALVFWLPLLPWNLRMKQLVSWSRAPWHQTLTHLSSPSQAGYEKISMGTLGGWWQTIVGNSAQVLLADPRNRIIELEKELKGIFQIIQPIYLIKTIQSYVMTALHALTVISGWRTRKHFHEWTRRKYLLPHSCSLRGCWQRWDVTPPEFQSLLKSKAKRETLYVQLLKQRNTTQF